MNIEKIDVKKINIITVVNDRFTKSTVEMLLEQQLFFANKINEIIDVLNEKKELKCTYCDFKTEEKNEKFLGEHMDIKHFHFKNDWEKEFDKISINLENIFQQIENYERDGVEVFEVKDYIKKIKQFIRNLLK